MERIMENLNKFDVSGHRGSARKSAKERGDMDQWRPRSVIFDKTARKERKACRGKYRGELTDD